LKFEVDRAIEGSRPLLIVADGAVKDRRAVEISHCLRAAWDKQRSDSSLLWSLAHRVEEKFSLLARISVAGNPND
jgi:hypothetical protein